MYKNQKSELQPIEAVTMHTATTDCEKEAIYELRFKIFFEELSKPLPKSKKESEKLTDDLDENSILLYAKAGSRVIGTLRMTVGTTTTFPDWLSEIFSLKKIQPILHPNQKIGLLTKLAIDPAYRGTTLMYQFLKEILKISYDQNVKFAFGGCNPNLISFYERMGFIRFANKNFTEPGYGLLIPIVLITDYLEHFKAARATALRFVREKNPSISSAEGFLKKFPHVSNIINSRLVKGDDLWKYVSSKFPISSLENSLFFPALSLNEKISLLECGAIFSCSDGDIIVNRGERVSELYFVLSGTLATESSLLHPGQFFGCNLNTSMVQDKNIIAIEEAELLVISQQQFEKYKQGNPFAISYIFENLAKIKNKKGPEQFVLEELK